MDDAGPLTGARAFLDALVAQDVRHFFNVPGNGLGPVLRELFDYPSLHYVLGLHEGGLVAMADGYARASGRPSFANVYMAPGTANALSSIYTAHRDKSAVVVTSTQQARATVGRDAYASGDLVAAVRPFTKWAWEVAKPERLAEALHRAFKIAATPPLGPVFLSIPSDLFPAEIDGPLTEPSRPTAVPRLGPPRPEQVQAIADRIAGADRILLVCGQDVLLTGAVEAVDALARHVGAAVVSEPWNSTLAFPDPHDLGFGEYNREILGRLAPDVIVGIGARMFVEALGSPEPGFPDGTALLALGQSSDELGRMHPAEVACHCDVRLGVEAVHVALRDRVDDRRRSERLAHLGAYRDQITADRRALLEEYHDRSPMSLARMAVELNRVVDRDTVIVEQSTTSGGMIRAFLDQLSPYRWFGTGGSVQGWAPGAAVGVQLARPGEPVLALLGDGGLAFSPQPVWTAGHYGIPVTWLVIDNQGYRSTRGNVHDLMQAPTAAKPDFGFDFAVDVAAVAQGFGGVRVDRVTDPADLADTVKHALADDAPRIVHAVISPEVEFLKSHGAPMAV